MRNILKGFLEPKAETYVLPDTDSIFMGGEDEFVPLAAEEISHDSLDITLEAEAPEEEPRPNQRRSPSRRLPSIMPSFRLN